MTLKTASLQPAILTIIHEQQIEPPFSGEYHDFFADGTYICRKCGLGLYTSSAKIASKLGFPTFNKSLNDAINMEAFLYCIRCAAFLGKVIKHEKLHQVNSAGIEFVPHIGIIDTEEAIFAGGCFWGVEYHLHELPGVLKTEVGFIGGTTEKPTHNDIFSGTTGHCEAVRVVYNPNQINYEALTKYFFEIHHPFREDPTIFPRPKQYRSAIFYYDEIQKTIAHSLIQQLEALGPAISTEVTPISTFWPAGEFDQQFYKKRNQQAECHFYVKRFPT